VDLSQQQPEHRQRWQQGLFTARDHWRQRQQGLFPARDHRRRQQQGLFAAEFVGGSGNKGCLPQEIIVGGSKGCLPQRSSAAAAAKAVCR
jgi:hypothetical protein